MSELWWARVWETCEKCGEMTRLLCQRCGRCPDCCIGHRHG